MIFTLEVVLWISLPRFSMTKLTATVQNHHETTEKMKESQFRHLGKVLQGFAIINKWKILISFYGAVTVEKATTQEINETILFSF